MGERARVRLLGTLLVGLLLGAQFAAMRRVPSRPLLAVLLLLAACVALALVQEVRASASRQEEAREARLAEALRATRRMRERAGTTGRAVDDGVR